MLIVPNLRRDLDALRADFGAEVLRNAVKDGWSVHDMAAGIADAFTDATGIGALGGATYDATGKYLHNPGGYGSDLTTGCVPTLSAGTGAANAVDDTSTTYFPLVGGGDVPSGTTLRFNLSAPPPVTKWTYRTANVALDLGRVTAVALQGFNGSTWATLDTLPGGMTINTSYERTFVNTTAYQDYRLQFTLSSIANTFGAEVALYADAPAASVAPVSVAFATGAAVSAVRVIALWQPVDAAVLGSDCLLDVSADNGATWAPVTLSDLGKFDATTRIIGGIAPVAGSQVKWRWRTANAKAQRLRGIWPQWR